MKFVEKVVVEEDFDLVNAFAHLLASIHNQKSVNKDFTTLFFKYSGKRYKLTMIVEESDLEDISLEFRS